MTDSEFGPFSNINSLLREIKRQFGQAAIGTGLYMSKDPAHAVLVGSIQTPWENEGIVVNHVLGRLLKEKDSCGARSAIRAEQTNLPSFMVKGHHCINIPLDTSRSSVQIVTKKPLAMDEVVGHPSVQTLMQQIEMNTQTLRHEAGGDVSQMIPVQENRPAHLMLEFDITGFSALFYYRGKEKAFELREALQHSIQQDLVDQLHADCEFLDRDGGDAFWVAFDLMRLFPTRDDYEQHFGLYLNNVVIPAIDQTIQSFARRSDDLGMQGRTSLKAIMSLGDLYTFHGANPTPCPVYSGHPLVAMEAFSIQANRNGSSITMGDDVARHVDETKYTLTRQVARSKAALYTQRIASLQSMP